MMVERPVPVPNGGDALMPARVRGDAALVLVVRGRRRGASSGVAGAAQRLTLQLIETEDTPGGGLTVILRLKAAP